MSDGSEAPAVGGPPHREGDAETSGSRHPFAARRDEGFPPAAFVDVAALHQLPEGGMAGVTLPDGTAVCLFNHAGTVGAVSDRCTHAEFRLSEGALHADGTIECVWHGARFDCRTGAVRRSPAIDPVAVFAVAVREGRVLVAPAPSPATRP